MMYLRRLFGLAVATLVLLTMLAPNAASLSRAQDANTVTVDGSKVVSPILQAAVKQYVQSHADAKITVNVSGTDAGFEKLCAGSLDIAMANRSISDAEDAACNQKSVKYTELVLGYDALVVLVNSASKITCISATQLNKLLAAGTTTVNNWNVVDSTLGDNPISAVYAPPADSQAVQLANTIVPGGKLRTDIQSQDKGATVAQKVNGDPTGVGIITVADNDSIQGQQLAVKALQLKTTADCVDPTVPNMEEGRYPAAETLYAYVNTTSLDRAAVKDFATYLVGSDAPGFVRSSGFEPADTTSYDRAQNYITTKQVGRTFSRIRSVNVPANTTGTITSDGSPDVQPIIKAIGDAFKPRYASITVTAIALGDDVGYSKLCSNGLDLIGTTRLPTDAETAACKKVNVQTMGVQLGINAVVVVVNGNNKFATCLTTDQIGKIFGVDSQGKVKKWSDVSSDFPATDLTILTPTDGSAVTDLLLLKSIKGIAPIPRTDVTEQNDDALYRGTATQNVAGAITYMTYADFLKVKANVHPVAINAGNGCVDPNEANLKANKYPLAEPLYAVLNMGAEPVQPIGSGNGGSYRAGDGNARRDPGGDLSRNARKYRREVNVNKQ